MDQLLKLLGGLPGLVGLLVAAGAVFWRTKFPQIGIDYLTRELELHRVELAAADRERAKDRAELKALRGEIGDLNERYMRVLTEREDLTQRLRRCERTLKEHGLGVERSEEGDVS